MVIEGMHYNPDCSCKSCKQLNQPMTKNNKKKISKNERAEKLVGKRLEGGNPIDYPCEIGYWCPICKIEWDEDLQFSEYNGFMWCPRCNKDYPSPLCAKDIDFGTKVYLDIIEEISTHKD